MPPVTPEAPKRNMLKAIGQLPDRMLERLGDWLRGKPFWVIMGILGCPFVLAMVYWKFHPLSAVRVLNLLFFACLFTVIATLVVATGFMRDWKRRFILRQNMTLQEIRMLRWDDFETLVAEVFRCENYSYEHLGSDQPDGGVDIQIQKDSKTFLVQCKHYQYEKVGVELVRQLAGLVAVRGADGGIFVTSSEFSEPAKEEFKAVSWMELVDGTVLADRVNRLRPVLDAAERSTSQGLNSVVGMLLERAEKEPYFFRVHKCTLCGARMVLRWKVDLPFWGCSNFVKSECRYTQPLSAAENEILNPKGHGRKRS